MPFFSIIIPVRDRPNLLIRAVNSVIHQTCKDWECHIIDDGSHSPHPQYAKFSSSPHNSGNSGKITYHYFPPNPNSRGVAWARNQGFRYSQGEWISFLDSDDVWLPKKLIEAKKFITAHSHLRIFQTEEIWIRNGRRVNPPAHLQKREGNIFQESLKRCLITTSSVVVHNSLLKNNSWDERLPACEDYDLWIQLTAHNQVGLVPQSLTIRYQDYGGRQLSKEYPVMDMFRLYALKKFICKEKKVKIDKRLQAGEILKIKTKIVLTGAIRRGNFWLYLKVLFGYRFWFQLWVWFFSDRHVQKN